MRRLMLVVTASLFALPLRAQVRTPDSLPTYDQRELDGPRVGVAWIAGDRALAKLAEHNLRPVMSVFGWHFEQVTRSRNGGPQLVAQQVLVVAGLDQGTAIPSGTFVVGMRFSNGMEFGMGPNVSPLGAALAVGIGKSLRAGDVTIPINLGFVVSRGSTRTTLLAGYALRRR